MRHIIALLALVAVLAQVKSPVLASFDPLNHTPNNKVGVHILSPSEVGEAAKLVNSSGGDWGYVTVPIQPTDRDPLTWTNFMTACKNLHLIPIIRITTLPEGGTWADPDPTDLVDFANFLNNLPWPVANRYIILFNEVNRQEEWGGKVDPAAYARILHNASLIFKSRSPDFFLLGAGLDSALPNSNTSLSSSLYLTKLQETDSQVFTYLDGFASHSYPNPAFRARPTKSGWQSITSYREELARTKLKDKPIFITETGWDTSLPEATLQAYWRQAWQTWNSDPRVVAVTPFILQGGSAYNALSLLAQDGQPTASYETILSLTKVKGSPPLAVASSSPPQDTATYSSGESTNIGSHPNFFLFLENFIRQLFGLLPRGTLSLKGHTLKVELATTSKAWTQGLSGRTALGEDEGMLFVFPSSHIPSFWMKDMHFPLDIIWINQGRVVDITNDVPPPSGDNLPTYSPSHLSDQVLEVQAGYAAKINLQPGDLIIRDY